QSWIDVLDPRKVNQYGQRGLERFVLPGQDNNNRYTDGVVTLLTDRPGDVYERGLLIPGESDQPRMFGYNVDETIIDTRERNAFSEKLLEGYVREYFRNLTDTEVMRQMLQTIKQNPNTNYYEYRFFKSGTNTISERSKALWRQ